MIYLPDYGLFFIHVPKSGGLSTVRAIERAAEPSLREQANDLGVENMREHTFSFDHPHLGQIHPAHVPLWGLAEYFPESWAAFKTSKSFALTRAPRDRFFSAVMQRLREFRGADAMRSDDPMVTEEARAVCDWLSSRPRHADREYSHFIRQVDFVDLDGERQVDAVFPLDAMGQVQDWVKRETGLQLEIKHEHARRQPEPWARPFMPIARFAGRKLMPRSVRRALYPIWTSSAAFSNASGGYDQIDLGVEYEKFIAEYYAPDTALHQEAVEKAERARAERRS